MGLEVRDSILRAEFGTDLTVRVAGRLGAAFARFLHERGPSPLVVLGRDTRATGASLLTQFASGLAAYPCRVIDAGVVPTPSLLVAAEEWGTRAAVMVTAGRAPHDWNGFKFTLGGRPLDTAEMKELYELYKWTPAVKTAKPILEKRYGQSGALHVDRATALFEREALDKLDLKVAIDTGRGAAEAPMMALLDALKAKSFPVHTVRDHTAPELGLKPLATRVIRSACELGVATGWEGSLLLLVDEKGRRLTRHQTVGLAAHSFLELRREGVLVVQGELSQMVRELAREHRAEVRPVSSLRAAVEELAALRKLQKPALGIDFFGEITWNEVCYAPDSLAALLLVLRLMARSRKPLSQLCEDLPPFASAEVSLPRPPEAQPARLLEQLARRFPKARLSHPGKRLVRADFPNGAWLGLMESFETGSLDVWAETPLPDRPEDLLAAVEELLGFPPIKARVKAP